MGHYIIVVPHNSIKSLAWSMDDIVLNFEYITIPERMAAESTSTTRLGFSIYNEHNDSDNVWKICTLNKIFERFVWHVCLLWFG